MRRLHPDRVGIFGGAIRRGYQNMATENRKPGGRAIRHRTTPKVTHKQYTARIAELVSVRNWLTAGKIEAMADRIQRAIDLLVQLTNEGK